VLRKLCSGDRRERGQSLILLVLGITVMFVVGAIVVDVGLWLSERRGSQTDADFAATAGAFELLDPASSAADAHAAAMANLADNDEQLNILYPPNGGTNVLVDDSCFDRGVDDAVTVDVEHDSRGLFFDIFGVTEPDIGAHAKACVGAVQNPGDLVPFHVTDNPGPCFDTGEQPIFGELCPVENGAHGGSPNRGLLDLEAGQYCSNQGGSGDVVDTIEWGADGTCLIDDDGDCDGPSDNAGYYDCVFAQPGNTGNVLTGVNRRVSRDGACDFLYGDGDGRDEFAESVELVFNGTVDIFQARDCDLDAEGIQKSPRLITLIVLEEDADQNDPSPIIAFAGFFIGGCGDERDFPGLIDDEQDLDPYCGDKIVSAPVAEPELYVAAPGAGLVPRPAACHQNQNPNPHGPNATPCATATPTPTPTPIPTPTPTVSPGGSSATSSPSPSPSGSPSPTPGISSCPPGHCTVFGTFVTLIVAGADIGEPTDQTTLFGISLVE
jgi:hypothetical protein